MLEIRLLGQFDVRLDGEPVEIPSRPAQSLLAYLTLNAGTQHRREKLAGMLWPESDESNARSNLRHALWRIRKAIGEEFLLADKMSVAFAETADYWLDASLLDDEVRDDLTEVVSLYEGELLPGFYDDWVLGERARLQAIYERRMQTMLAHLIDSQRWDEVLDWGERWIALGQVPEFAYRALMMAHGTLGDVSSMAAVYRRCVEALNEDLGVEPSEQTRQLYEQLSRGETPQAAATLGTTIAADRPAPQQPAFLEDKSDSAEDVPLAPTFVGRERELAWLEEALDLALTGQGQVVFVTGDAGAGKTALVDEFSRRAQSLHENLIVASGSSNVHTGIGDPYLTLREVMAMLTGDVQAKWAAGLVSRDHARRLWNLMPHTARALIDHGPDLIDILVPGTALLSRARAAAPSGSPWLSQLTDLIERRHTVPADMTQGYFFEQFASLLHSLSAQQPLLITLDDLQWADGDTISLLFHLGRHLEGSRFMLVGSYRPDEVALGRDGNRHPLEKVLSEFKRLFGDVWIDLGVAEETDGRNFVDAYLDTEPNQLGEAFRDALFRHTNGHALFTVELLRAMQERGDLVQDSEGKWIEGPVLDWNQLPARVEGVIEERVGRLEAETRDLLSVASVEGEKFTAQAVAIVQGTDERQVLSLLSQELERRHRLVREQGDIEINQRLLSQFQFAHILFQRYLYDNLGAGEQRILHREIAEALESLYAARVDEIALPLAEHYLKAGNTEKAVFHLIEVGHQARRIGAHQEALAFWERVLALVAGQEDTTALDRRAAAQRKLGSIYQIFGQWDTATQHLEEGLSIARQLDDQQGALSALSRLGVVKFKQGQLEPARSYLEDALALGRALGDEARTARALVWLGTTVAFTRHEGAYDQSRALLEEALALVGESGQQSLKALALHRLGETTRIHQKHEDARALYEEALEIYQELGDRAGVAMIEVNKGHVAAAIGDHDAARQSYSQALQVTVPTGMVPVTLEMVAGTAGLLASAGETDRPAEWLGFVLNHPSTQVEARDLADPLLKRLKATLPADTLQDSLTRGRQLNLDLIVAEIREHLQPS